MNRRWLAAILIAVMGISMIGGCSKKESEEESAQAGEYFENPESSEGEGAQGGTDSDNENASYDDSSANEDPDDSVSNTGEDDDQSDSSDQGNSSDGQKPGSGGQSSNSQNSSASQGAGSSQNQSSDQSNQKPGSSGSGATGNQNQKPNNSGNTGSNSAEDEDSDENDEAKNTVELDYGWIDQDSEDIYINTPVSKTPAKTSDGTSYYKENKIKVVSYNIRCANDPDGNSLDEREWRLDEILQKYDADIMGFQEVTEGWEGRLHMMLSDEYDYVMVYRSEDGGKEANPIFYKPSKFKLLDAGYFWLSETPEEMGKGWDADHYRICTWVKLKVRKTGAEFIYFNTHVDYKAGPQVPSAELLISRMKSIGGGLGGIVTGDFNLTHSAPAYTTMCGYFADSNMATVKDTSQGTFPNYGKNKNGGNIIDYCFFTPKKMKAISYKVMTDLVDGKYASDHFGVCSEIIILN